MVPSIPINKFIELHCGSALGIACSPTWCTEWPSWAWAVISVTIGLCFSHAVLSRGVAVVKICEFPLVKSKDLINQVNSCDMFRSSEKSPTHCQI